MPKHDASTSSAAARKPPLEPEPLHFDLKFLLVGDSGAGKTHLAGTYDRGPVHFYELDPGGYRTLYKLLPARQHELTVDKFSPARTSYRDFWKQVQRDGRDGFFESMAEQSGLVVLPDSLSTASDMALKDIAATNKRSLLDQSQPMRQQDWGQRLAWLKQLIEVIVNAPCAMCVTAHLMNEFDSDQRLIGRYPLIGGQLNKYIGNQFDEVYLLEPRSKSYNIYFKEVDRFTAKSRLFTPRSVKDLDMNAIADAYLAGNDLGGARSARSTSAQSKQRNGAKEDDDE